MKNHLLLLLLAAPALGSCAGPPQQLSIHDLEEAHRLADLGAYNDAEDILDDFDAEDFDLPTQRDYNLLYGRVSDGRNDWNSAIRHYEAYMVQSGPAQDARQAEQRLLELGTQLLEGDLKVFFIFTDKSRGVITLENLALLGHDPHTRAAAMARVASYHFDGGDYDDAMIFYAGLLQPDFRGLGWDDSASFQLANCHYGLISLSSLNGPAIRFALEQYRAYLERYPGGLHRVEAQRQFDISRDLLSQYHRMVGDYYVRIDNPMGARHHYLLAAGEVSQGDDSLVNLVFGTPAAADARKILASMDQDS